MLRAAVALAAATGLAACQSEPRGPQTEPETLEANRVSGFAGLSAAQAPAVAETGRAILARNGTVADAAVAMAFTASVTVPSRAGLGGGGVCMIHRRKAGTTTVLTFPPGRGGDGAAAPALVRGMAVLHDAHGRSSWGALVRPARRLARDGFQVSRVLANDFDAAGERLSEHARRAFARWDRRLPSAGDRITQPGLAATLNGLREQGPGYAYTTPFVPRFLQAAADTGYDLNAGALRGVRTHTADTLVLTVGERRLHLPPPPALGGLAAAQTLRLMDATAGLGATTGADRAHAVIEALKRTWSQQRLWTESTGVEPGAFLSDARIRALTRGWSSQTPTPAGDLAPAPMDADRVPPGTGFVVADRFGNVVTCGLTMNGLFGTGDLAQGTGILLASAGDEETSLGGLVPALFTTADGSRATGGLVAADGGTAPGTLAQVLDRLAGGAKIADAVATPRVHHPGQPDAARVARAMPWQEMQDLREMGHDVRIRDHLGTISAVVCPASGDGAMASCRAASDARGSGVALRAE
ncbi:gamma-glutamyltranspeptidase / glutathione hydrolase [Limimonas halophila]|uniref:Gamma-glutamyltranspeptidase / glutathione hydrolase n=1 Tax=Limimonas halophila TaxID=1082479 RepID=A0A1G7QYL1_9PROT|nr:gamma-glutamyltransferase [Limimonas halophila]SDG02959.1 gamma-glutamyltranspeptidase / glutathione hydrolase [Limimonas halophila]